MQGAPPWIGSPHPYPPGWRLTLTLPAPLPSPPRRCVSPQMTCLLIGVVVMLLAILMIVLKLAGVAAVIG